MSIRVAWDKMLDLTDSYQYFLQSCRAILAKQGYPNNFIIDMVTIQSSLAGIVLDFIGWSQPVGEKSKNWRRRQVGRGVGYSPVGRWNRMLCQADGWAGTTAAVQEEGKQSGVVLSGACPPHLQQVLRRSQAGHAPCCSTSLPASACSRATDFFGEEGESAQISLKITRSP